MTARPRPVAPSIGDSLVERWASRAEATKPELVDQGEPPLAPLPELRPPLTPAERKRYGIALLLSLIAHALLFTIDFGGSEFGWPGFGFPWQDRRVEVPDLRVVVAPIPIAADPAARTVSKPVAAAPDKPARKTAPIEKVAPRPSPVATDPTSTARVDATTSLPPQDAASDTTVAAAPSTRDEPARATPIATPGPAVIAVERSDDAVLFVPPAPLDVPPVAASLSAPDVKALDAVPLEALHQAAERQDAARSAAENAEAQRLEAARQQALRDEAERAAAPRQEAERLASLQLREAERRRAEQELARIEAARIDAEREEAARAQTTKLDDERRELAREEAARQDAARIDAERVDAERLEAMRSRAAKDAADRLEADAARQRAASEAARREAARAEAARIEAERDDAARSAAAAKADADRRQASRDAAEQSARAEARRLESERAEAARAQAARDEAARAEAERLDAQRQEAARSQAADDDAERREAVLRKIGRQLDAEAAQRAAASVPSAQRDKLPYSLSTPRRGRLWGRADPNTDLVLYAEAWARKIQLNTPVEIVDELTKRPHIDPLVTVAIRRDGSVESVTIHVSSGSAATDEALRRIVQSHEHYQAFPPSLARDFDVIEIRRTWIFDGAIRLY